MTDNYWLVAYLIHCQVSFFPSKTKQTKKFNLLSYEKSILHLLSRLLLKRRIFNNSISSSAIIITNILHKSNSPLLISFNWETTVENKLYKNYYCYNCTKNIFHKKLSFTKCKNKKATSWKSLDHKRVSDSRLIIVLKRYLGNESRRKWWKGWD